MIRRDRKTYTRTLRFIKTEESLSTIIIFFTAALEHQFFGSELTALIRGKINYDG